MSSHDESERAIRELVIANRILSHEGVLDAFGHLSIRDRKRPDRYWMARSRSPELVEAADIMEFDLDSNPVDQRGRAMYGERPIHGCIYAARPDVMAVCHNHAHSLVPFGVTGAVIKPIWHMAAGIGSEVPIWDIREQFGETDLLVTSNDKGRSLADKLAQRRVCLMRGHGGVVAAHDIKATVFIAIYLMINAALLKEAREMGEVKPLSDGEIRLASETLLSPIAQDRAWEYWCRRAGFAADPED
jgi:ribulose-5-phosphate 4-epimerase/fuculose-1-phosphate aldolase